MKNLILFLSFTCTLFANIPEKTIYEGELKVFMEAPFKHDYEKLSTFTTEEEKQAKGGDERRFQDFLKKQSEAINSTGSTISDIVVHDAHSYVKTEENAYFLVQVDYVKTVYGKKFELSHLFMGVQRPPSTINTYINTSRYGRDRMAKLYKDLPDTILIQIREKLPSKAFNSNHEEVENPLSKENVVLEPEDDAPETEGE